MGIFAVRIVTHDGVEDLKVYASKEDAGRRFIAAWVKMTEDLGQPLAGESVGTEKRMRAQQLVGVESVERVEFHVCAATTVREAALEVREGRSRVTSWRSLEDSYGSLLEF